MPGVGTVNPWYKLAKFPTDFNEVIVDFRNGFRVVNDEQACIVINVRKAPLEGREEGVCTLLQVGYRPLLPHNQSSDYSRVRDEDPDSVGKHHFVIIHSVQRTNLHLSTISSSSARRLSDLTMLLHLHRVFEIFLFHYDLVWVAVKL